MFKVVELEVVQGNAKILARGLVNTGDLNVKVALLAGPNGPWVALPSREYTHNGARKFDKQVLLVNEEAGEDLLKTVLAAYSSASKSKGQAAASTDDIPF